jgi:pyruvate dehydrogenase E2 component (dihydrolipoamide acetyltransferase)
MPFTLTMPKLSPTMEGGTIVKWHKKEGELVQPGDLLMDVATDKATVEYASIDEGWLRQIIVPDGKEAIVNQPIAVFSEDKDENIKDYKTQPEAKEEKPAQDETEKKSERKPAEQAPKQAGAAMQQPSFVPEPPLEKYTFEYPTEKQDKRIAASPLAKKLAKEKGLDLTTIKGTGPGDRIVERDLEKAQSSSIVNFGNRETPKETPGSYDEISLSPMRKVVGQRLQESKSFIPHFYVTQTINAEMLAGTREQLKNNNFKISINDFVIRATALALRQHPEVNTGFNSVNQTIIQFKTVDIAIAVGVDGGLITPIIRHADYKNLGEISVEAKLLATKARDGKLLPQEYKGGSFTISNLGMYGVTEFQAILNPPQAAILAVSGILDVPVISKGQVVPGKTMNLTLSVDHRVIDGVIAAKFLQTLKNLLENPALLLVN